MAFVRGFLGSTQDGIFFCLKRDKNFGTLTTCCSGIDAAYAGVAQLVRAWDS